MLLLQTKIEAYASERSKRAWNLLKAYRQVITLASEVDGSVNLVNLVQLVGFGWLWFPSATDLFGLIMSCWFPMVNQ